MSETYSDFQSLLSGVFTPSPFLPVRIESLLFPLIPRSHQGNSAAQPAFPEFIINLGWALGSNRVMVKCGSRRQPSGLVVTRFRPVVLRILPWLIEPARKAEDKGVRQVRRIRSPPFQLVLAFPLGTAPPEIGVIQRGRQFAGQLRILGNTAVFFSNQSRARKPENSHSAALLKNSKGMRQGVKEIEPSLWRERGSPDD